MAARGERAHGHVRHRAAANYDAIQCTPTSSSIVTLTAASLIPLGPVLAGAGFYPASPLPVPANSAQAAWATFTNVTGLTAALPASVTS